MRKIVEAIRAGEVIIYPTETLYAIGAGAYFEESAARVVALKARPATKPLPLIIGSIEQLHMVTGWVSKAFENLMHEFWPGPLSVLVPARRDLPPQVKDDRGFSSLRVTTHPTAMKLCLQANMPLIATSANISGGKAAAVPKELDPRLTGAVKHKVLDKPWPKLGTPSTVVRCVGTDRLHVIREGAVSVKSLEKAGFVVVMLDG